MTVLVCLTAMIYCQNNFKLLFTILAGSGSFIYLLFLLAISFKNTRTSINIKTLSILFMGNNIGVLIYFSGANRTESLFVIVYSIFILLYSSMAYSIVRSKM